MFYKRLGKLPDDTILYLKQEVLKRRKKLDEVYQHIHFDYKLMEEFLEIFSNDELTISEAPAMRDLPARPVMKVFYSPVMSGFGIHKDGIRDKSALNIALSSGIEDWVRWYDDESILKLMERNVLSAVGPGGAHSRDSHLPEYENIPYLEELRVETGDVYAVNTDIFHSFKCLGNSPRMILQVKFKENLPIEDLVDKLSKKSFVNLI